VENFLKRLRATEEEDDDSDWPGFPRVRQLSLNGLAVQDAKKFSEDKFRTFLDYFPALEELMVTFRPNFRPHREKMDQQYLKFLSTVAARQARPVRIVQAGTDEAQRLFAWRK
jgi:hypothetical protein